MMWCRHPQKMHASLKKVWTDPKNSQINSNMFETFWSTFPTFVNKIRLKHCFAYKHVSNILGNVSNICFWETNSEEGPDSTVKIGIHEGDKPHASSKDETGSLVMKLCFEYKHV